MTHSSVADKQSTLKETRKQDNKCKHVENNTQLHRTFKVYKYDSLSRWSLPHLVLLLLHEYRHHMNHIFRKWGEIRQCVILTIVKCNDGL